MAKQQSKKTKQNDTKAPKRERVTLKVRAKQAWQRVVVRTPKNLHHTLRLTKPRMYVTSADLKAAWRLQIEAWKFIGQYKRILLGLGLIYSLIAYLLVG